MMKQFFGTDQISFQDVHDAHGGSTAAMRPRAPLYNSSPRRRRNMYSRIFSGYHFRKR